MKTSRFYFLIFAVAFAFLSSCSKNSGQQEEGKGYIPEPASSSEKTDESGKKPDEMTSEEKDRIASNDAGNKNPDEEKDSDEKKDSDDVKESEAKQNSSEETAKTDETVKNDGEGNKPDDNSKESGKNSDDNNVSASTETASAVQTSEQNNVPAENGSSSESSPQTETADNSNNAENAENSSSTGNAGEQRATVAQPDAPVPQPEALFGSCDRLHEFMDVCSPFKCSVASNFLGQTIDDTYEVKGIRNGKCRYVTGLHMEAKGKVTDNASLICNFEEEDRHTAAEFLKNPKNLKSSVITGISENKNNGSNPFVKFFADNVCVQACKKNQNEIEQIVLENGHFVSKKVRCPSED